MASLKKCCAAKPRPLLAVFIIVVVLLSTPSFYYTSPPNFVMGRELPENSASSSQTKEDVGISMRKLCCMKKKEGPCPLPCPTSLEESAREVPTGPDPLHHHDKPITP